MRFIFYLGFLVLGCLEKCLKIRVFAISRKIQQIDGLVQRQSGQGLRNILFCRTQSGEVTEVHVLLTKELVSMLMTLEALKQLRHKWNWQIMRQIIEITNFLYRFGAKKDLRHF